MLLGASKDPSTKPTEPASVSFFFQIILTHAEKLQQQPKFTMSLLRLHTYALYTYHIRLLRYYFSEPKSCAWQTYSWAYIMTLLYVWLGAYTKFTWKRNGGFPFPFIRKATSSLIFFKVLLFSKKNSNSFRSLWKCPPPRAAPSDNVGGEMYPPFMVGANLCYMCGLNIGNTGSCIEHGRWG